MEKFIKKVNKMEEKLKSMMFDIEKIKNPDLQKLMLNFKIIGFTNKDFSDWLCNNVEFAKMNDPKNMSNLNKKLPKFLERYKPKYKECYYQALFCSIELSVDYVEGYVIYLGLPMLHAWNCYKGQHFDIIDLILYNGKIGNHYKILYLPREKVMEYAVELEQTGSFINHHYIKNFWKK